MTGIYYTWKQKDSYAMENDFQNKSSMFLLTTMLLCNESGMWNAVCVTRHECSKLKNLQGFLGLICPLGSKKREQSRAGQGRMFILQTHQKEVSQHLSLKNSFSQKAIDCRQVTSQDIQSEFHPRV